MRNRIPMSIITPSIFLLRLPAGESSVYLLCATDVHLQASQQSYHHRLVWNHHSIICGCYLRLTLPRANIAGQIPMEGRSKVSV